MLDDFPSLRAQRDAFRAAAEREIGATARPRRRRRLRRAAAVAAAAVVGVGGVAAATELIAIGEPEPDRVDRPAARLPTERYDIAVTAPDTPLRWGVGVFPNSDGRLCALAGQLRGSTLGLIRDGTFRPYSADTGGSCRAPGSRGRIVDSRVVGDRFITFGLGPPGTARVTFVERRGGERTAAASPEGAFLFVYDKTTTPDDFSTVIYRDAAGRRLP